MRTKQASIAECVPNSDGPEEDQEKLEDLRKGVSEKIDHACISAIGFDCHVDESGDWYDFQDGPNTAHE